MIPGQIMRGDGSGWMAAGVHRWDGSEWVPLQGGLAFQPPPFTPAGGTVTNAASGLFALGAGAAYGGVGQASFTNHMLHTDEDQLVLRWVNSTATMAPTTADAEFRVAVKSPSNPEWIDVTFGGQPSALIAKASGNPGATSDPIKGVWRNGEEVTVLVHARIMTPDGTGTGAVSNGSTWPGDGGVIKNITFDAAKAAEPTGTALPGMRPTMILGRMPNPSGSWFLIGDSITAGTGANTHSHLEIAMRERGLRYTGWAYGGSGYRNISSGPESGSYRTRGGEMLESGHADSVITALGINDGDATASASATWAHWRTSGAKRIVQVTLFPASMTTPREGARTFNAWLRDGAPMLGSTPAPTGTTDPTAVRATFIDNVGSIKRGSAEHPLGEGWITDMAAPVETSIGSGLWNMDVGRDTLHPSGAAHQIAGVRIARDLALMGF